jgi:hypothetical protein
MLVDGERQRVYGKAMQVQGKSGGGGKRRPRQRRGKWQGGVCEGIVKCGASPFPVLFLFFLSQSYGGSGDAFVAEIGPSTAVPAITAISPDTGSSSSGVK